MERATVVEEFRKGLEDFGVKMSDENFEKLIYESNLIEEIISLGYFEYEGGKEAQNYLVNAVIKRILWLGQKEDKENE